MAPSISPPPGVSSDAADGRYERLTNRNSVNGYAGLDGSGKVDVGVIPALKSHEFTVVANAAARKTQTVSQVQPGDESYEQDTNYTYKLIATDPALDASWVLVSDTSPDWSTIASKPVAIAALADPAPYLSLLPGTTDQITANQNSYNPGLRNGTIRLSSDGNYNITGLTFGSTPAAGEEHTLINANTSSTLTLKHESASSTAANRFNIEGAADLTLAGNHSCIIRYDSVISRWRVLGFFVLTAGATDAGDLVVFVDPTGRNLGTGGLNIGSLATNAQLGEYVTGNQYNTEKIQYAVKGSSETIFNDDVLGPDEVLQLSAPLNARYKFEILLQVDTHANAGFQVALTANNAVDDIEAQIEIFSNDTNMLVASDRVTALDVPIGVAGDTSYFVRISGVVEPPSGETVFGPAWAQQIFDAHDTTVRKLSNFELVKAFDI